MRNGDASFCQIILITCRCLYSLFMYAGNNWEGDGEMSARVRRLRPWCRWVVDGRTDGGGVKAGCRRSISGMINATLHMVVLLPQSAGGEHVYNSDQLSHQSLTNTPALTAVITVEC